MIKKIILATTNKGKIREIRSIIEGAGDVYEFSGLDELKDVPDIIEDGKTFRDNAYKKAKTIYEITGKNIVSEDSGLCVDFLNGAPGVFSARFANGDLPIGSSNFDLDNINKLLKLMKDVPDDKRSAQFRSVFCLILEGKEYFFDGQIDGHITNMARGKQGFGYDPVFVPNGYSQTFGELGDDIKNSISHRSMALRKLRDFLLVF